MARAPREGVNYLVWTLVALVGYTLFTPLASIATSEVPSSVVALVANSILLLSAAGVVAYQNEPVFPQITGQSALHMVGAGVFLTIGILAYYRALATGPVSIVTPIYGMFLVGSSVLSILFLGESLSLQKGAGIVLAVVAVYLTATG